MVLYFTGIVIAISCFLIIGLFHPIVIKTEYYTGTKYWWMFLVVGLACIAAALFIANTMVSAVLGIFRVIKGWFPMNPKRKGEYPA